MDSVNFNNTDLLCSDLPTQPIENYGKILITGASGYIGGRLISELAARGYSLRLMVRGDSKDYRDQWPDHEIFQCDAHDPDRVNITLKGIDTVYYLIHSLSLGRKEFEAADIKAARNFRIAAEKNNVKRIIYLGGMGDQTSPLSAHLKNRLEVANELRQGPVPVTILRAAIIIGSGSASYEIIKHLVQKLPFIPCPHWSKNKCQPISIRDAIKYMVGVLEVPETAGKDFCIGGREILSYEDMLKELGSVLGIKTYLLQIPFSNLCCYSYIASLVTPVPRSITACLMEGLINNVVCQSKEIYKFLDFTPISFREAVVRALSREEQDRVYTRWSDAYPPAHELAYKLHELHSHPTYSTVYSLETKQPAPSLFTSMCKIGGKEGWFNNTWMWKARGMIDRIFMGVGSSRGRKRYSSLRVNDVIDFWRVEDIITNKRLLLRAEMKLPGRAWLELKIKQGVNKNTISVIPYYYTNSWFGKLYWFIFLPFHHFLFKHLLEEIDRRCNKQPVV
ncbi:MAG: SDR family oxidoreductase [candidate division Zixibacteria bacterium]|nr:SDR family oxidoreductase [candidate division Zixibacteria bacterium]